MCVVVVMMTSVSSAFKRADLLFKGTSKREAPHVKDSTHDP